MVLMKGHLPMMSLVDNLGALLDRPETYNTRPMWRRFSAIILILIAPTASRISANQRPELIVQVGHGPGRSSQFIVSLDRRFFATSGDDGVRVWDAASGRLIKYLPMLTGGSFAFDIHGELLQVTGSGSRSFTRRFDWAEATELATIEYSYPRSEGSAVERIRQKLIPAAPAASPQTQTIQVVENRHAGVQKIVTHPDGAILTADDEGNICAWNSLTFQINKCLLKLSGPIDTFVLSPDGALLAAAGKDDAGFHIWKYPSLEELPPVIDEPDLTTIHLKFSLSGRLLALVLGTTNEKIKEKQFVRVMKC